jgi:hypothetical protein
MICKKGHLSNDGNDFVLILENLLANIAANGDVPAQSSLLKGSDDENEEREEREVPKLPCDGILDAETRSICGADCEKILWTAQGKTVPRHFCKVTHLYRYLVVNYLAQSKSGPKAKTEKKEPTNNSE